jgi:hypothetical protein
MRQFDRMPKQHYKAWEVCPHHLRIDLDKRFKSVITTPKHAFVISGHWCGIQIAEQYSLTHTELETIIRAGIDVSLVYKGRKYYLISEVIKKMKGRKYERNNGSV